MRDHRLLRPDYGHCTENDQELVRLAQAGYDGITIGVETRELEKLEEVRTLVEHLDFPVIFAALGASNAINREGQPPEDRVKLRSTLARIISHYSETDLRRYRENLPHL